LNAFPVILLLYHAAIVRTEPSLSNGFTSYNLIYINGYHGIFQAVTNISPKNAHLSVTALCIRIEIHDISQPGICWAKWTWTWTCGARGSVVVKALRYKPEDRGFDIRWGDYF
jgi:hypothetical protein